MKLRNKRTGEIGKPAFIGVDYEITILPEDKNKKARYYKTLAELNKEWEDVPEEPKEYWFIDYDGGIIPFNRNKETATDNLMKQIGNYFETKEEAEKAVEKLKAWHKLIGYWETEILGWEIRDMPTGGNWQTVNVKFNVKTRKEPMELLDLLFGGEE